MYPASTISSLLSVSIYLYQFPAWLLSILLSPLFVCVFIPLHDPTSPDHDDESAADALAVSFAHRHGGITSTDSDIQQGGGSIVFPSNSHQEVIRASASANKASIWTYWIAG